MTRSSRRLAVGSGTVLLVLVIVAWVAIGPGVAAGQSTGSYSVQQDDRCVAVTPLSGDESVLEFYGYESTFEDNPYTTSIGPGFSSVGTLDLQVPETSLLFLYSDSAGILSLVFVHGSREGGVDGGSASFDVTGLPADGRWAVKDDEYDSPNNEDDWTHGDTTAEIDWTWGRSATDGGAFEGLGDEFNVTIDPAFNGEAELFGQTHDGLVDNWTVLSGDREAPNRTSLDLEENVTVSSEPCEATTTVPEPGSTLTPGGRDEGADTATASDAGTTTSETTTTEEGTTTSEDSTTETGTITTEESTPDAGTTTTEESTTDDRGSGDDGASTDDRRFGDGEKGWFGHDAGNGDGWFGDDHSRDRDRDDGRHGNGFGFASGDGESGDRADHGFGPNWDDDSDDRGDDQADDDDDGGEDDD